MQVNVRYRNKSSQNKAFLIQKNATVLYRETLTVRETYKKSVEKDVRKALLFPNNHMICSQFETFSLKISQKATIHPFVSTKLYRTLHFTCSIQQRREKD